MVDKPDPVNVQLFTRPWRQMIYISTVLAAVAIGFWWGHTTIIEIFWSNVYLNTAILAVFVLGVLSCIRQLVMLFSSVRWIEEFAAGQDQAKGAPSLLAALATLLQDRGAHLQLSSSSTRSILDSVATRVDEDREITRYLANTMIFFGLLGTFYGLATTVPALVDTIRGLNPGADESGVEVFSRLQAGLEAQLGGMGTAFSSSLLGLAGSLIVGLLELLVGHGQNRFYRELEEWLSSLTRLGVTDESGAVDPNLLAQVIDQMAGQMQAMQGLLARAPAQGVEGNQIAQLTDAITRLTDRMAADEGASAAAMSRVAEGQDRLIAVLSRESGEGIDAESRMRLRSIDVQLLRIYEEISAGRQETVDDIRTEIAALSRALRGARVIRGDAGGEA